MPPTFTPGIHATLKGISQIFLQANAWTGFLFLCAITWHSPVMGVAALCGAWTGILFGKKLGIPEDKIQQGLCGYNAALIFMAMIQTPQTSWIEFAVVLFVSVLGILLATLLLKGAIRYQLPVLTAPFVIVVWLILAPLIDLGLVPAFASTDVQPSGKLNVLQLFTWSFGQVMFLNNTVSGILVLAGLFLAHWRATCWAAGAVLLSALTGIIAGWPLAAINEGLFGYNAVLVAFALMKLRWPWILSGVLLSCCLMHFFLIAGWAALTAPFVLSSWIILAVAYNLRKAGMGRPSQP